MTHRTRRSSARAQRAEPGQRAATSGTAARTHGASNTWQVSRKGQGGATTHVARLAAAATAAATATAAARLRVRAVAGDVSCKKQRG